MLWHVSGVHMSNRNVCVCWVRVCGMQLNGQAVESQGCNVSERNSNHILGVLGSYVLDTRNDGPCADDLVVAAAVVFVRVSAWCGKWF